MIRRHVYDSAKGGLMARILVINGSYRKDGVTDQTLHAMAEALRSQRAEVDTVVLRDFPIKFCRNCRECTRDPGEAPGDCVLEDGMREIVDRIEASDAYVLASPTNFGSATAIFKRFMERLVVYAYWPWEANAPKFRKAKPMRKKALIVTSSAAPALLSRRIDGTRKQLKSTARVLGARTVGSFSLGLVAKDPRYEIPDRARARARAAALKLL